MLTARTATDPQPWRARYETFLVTIEFESTFVDAAGNAHVRTGSVDVVEQAPHPRAAEAQARAAFTATAHCLHDKGEIREADTVGHSISMRRHCCHCVGGSMLLGL